MACSWHAEFSHSTCQTRRLLSPFRFSQTVSLLRSYLAVLDREHEAFGAGAANRIVSEGGGLATHPATARQRHGESRRPRCPPPSVQLRQSGLRDARAQGPRHTAQRAWP
ncbi:MAG: hypothetical protein ACRDSR_18720 [Pseudonocardiaceae bacterium]